MHIIETIQKNKQTTAEQKRKKKKQKLQIYGDLGVFCAKSEQILYYNTAVEPGK